MFKRRYRDRQPHTTNIASITLKPRTILLQVSIDSRSTHTAALEPLRSLTPNPVAMMPMSITPASFPNLANVDIRVIHPNHS